MDYSNRGATLIGLSLVIILSLYLFSFQSLNRLTGYVSGVDGGKTTKIENQEKLNPSKGILKGMVEYTIKDNNLVVNKEPAPNITLYFVVTGNQFTNYTKVKQLGDDESYKGEIEDIDADDSSSNCSTNDYTTKRNYYDLNDNNQEDENASEFKVYTVKTDSKGCYAVKLPTGSFDIYL